jgi:mannose-6-phosphate isomerase-like protein (cupin superfamily)
MHDAESADRVGGATVHVRRVVTGSSSDGKAVFVSDSLVDGVTLALLPGYEWHRIWGADGHIELPTDGKDQGPLAHIPPSVGFRFGLITVGPDSVAISDDIDLVAALDEMESKLPGLAALPEADDPSMHTTDTVDFEYVISGRVIAELDDGANVELGPGDTLVMNGTRHAWRNPFHEPCLMVTVMVGADRGTSTR